MDHKDYKEDHLDKKEGHQDSKHHHSEESKGHREHNSEKDHHSEQKDKGYVDKDKGRRKEGYRERGYKITAEREYFLNGKSYFIVVTNYRMISAPHTRQPTVASYIGYMRIGVINIAESIKILFVLRNYDQRQNYDRRTKLSQKIINTKVSRMLHKRVATFSYFTMLIQTP